MPCLALTQHIQGGCYLAHMTGALLQVLAFLVPIVHGLASQHHTPTGQQSNNNPHYTWTGWTCIVPILDQLAGCWTWPCIKVMWHNLLRLATVPIYGYNCTIYGYSMGANHPIYIPYPGHPEGLTVWWWWSWKPWYRSCRSYGVILKCRYSLPRSPE